MVLWLRMQGAILPLPHTVHQHHMNYEAPRCVIFSIAVSPVLSYFTHEYFNWTHFVLLCS
jgi:hypothetical protein